MNSKTHTWLSLLKTFFRNAYVISLILLPAAIATGCKDDISLNNQDNNGRFAETIPAGTKLYSYIRLLPVDGLPSRADGDENLNHDQYGPNDKYDADFEAGNESFESKIDNFLILFFDKDGNCIAHFESESKTQIKYDDDRVSDEDDEIDDGLAKNEDDGFIEKIGWDILIPVDVETAEKIEQLDDDSGIDSYFVIVNYNDDILKKNDEGKLTTCLLTYHDATLREYSIINKKNLETISFDQYQRIVGTVRNGFIMTSAGHFEGSKYYWADPKPAGNNVLYKTKNEAKEHPLTIFVERIAARADFSIDTDNIKPIEVFYNETDVYQLKFMPDCWALEATEKETYIPKNLEYDTKSEFNLTTNVYPGDFVDWIDYNNNRIFWSMSKAFKPTNDTHGIYPAKGTEKTEKVNLTLNYLTFEEIGSPQYQLKEKFGSKNILQGTLYNLEHTFKSDISGNMATTSELNNAVNPYAVPTSVVLRGRYTIEPVDPSTGEPGNPSTDEKLENGEVDDSKIPNGDNVITTTMLQKGFYIRYVDMERTDLESDPQKTYQYHLYLEENKEGKDDLLEAMLKEQYMIWEPVRDEAGEIIKDEKGEIVSFQPVRDSKNGLLAIINTYTRHDITDGEWIDASNTYTLQLKATGSDLYYKTSGDDSFHLIEDNNLTTANKALQKQLGYAQRYWQAYAFFYAPIPHYSGESDPFDISKGRRAYNGLFNYDQNEDFSYKKKTDGNYIVKHRTGDFGFVRNHIYNITINGIGNLGYGIPNIDVIPLPEPRLDHKLYQFDLELKILPWNVYEYTFDIEGRK